MAGPFSTNMQNVHGERVLCSSRRTGSVEFTAKEFYGVHEERVLCNYRLHIKFYLNISILKHLYLSALYL